MRRNGLHALALALLFAAVATVAWGVARGELSFALALFVPVIYGTGGLALLAFALLAGAAVAWFAGASRSFAEAAAREPAWRAPDEREPHAGAGEERVEPRARGGGVILLGPIPIVFGSDRRIAWTLALVGLALVIGLLALAWLQS